MSKRPLAAIILAAGQGTRMRSEKHKVLHSVAGKPMVHHLLDKVAELQAEHVVTVVGARRDQIEASLANRTVKLVVQEEQLGTGHAVLQAKEALHGFDGDVLILFGDAPLVSVATMQKMLARLSEQDLPRCVVLGFRTENPGHYGRIVADAYGTIMKMVEFKDASVEERAITLCNSGVMAVRGIELFDLLDQIDNQNAAGEYYLPDIVMLPGGQSVVVECDAWEVAGVNSRAELAEVEALWQARRRLEAMVDGATLIAPETVWFSSDTKIGSDVLIEPNVYFGPGVTVEDGATIHAFSHIEGAVIGKGSTVGPFARLRPGTKLDEGVKVGNFVEVKNTRMRDGAKANHLTYLGDADIGRNANIGAGTITCNYDGYFKYRTDIGEGAFIGSNSALIAPVKIGRGAIVAAGSAVSRDVADGEMRMVRAEQLVKPGWADRFNDAMRKKKSSHKP